MAKDDIRGIVTDSDGNPVTSGEIVVSNHSDPTESFTITPDSDGTYVIVSDIFPAGETYWQVEYRNPSNDTVGETNYTFVNVSKDPARINNMTGVTEIWSNSISRYEPPIVGDGTNVYVPDDGTLYNYDLTDGTTTWSDSNIGNGAGIEYYNNEIFVGDFSPAIHVYDNSGNQLTTYTDPFGNGDFPYSVWGDGNYIITAGPNGVTAIDRSDGTQAWLNTNIGADSEANRIGGDQGDNTVWIGDFENNNLNEVEIETGNVATQINAGAVNDVNKKDNILYYALDNGEVVKYVISVDSVAWRTNAFGEGEVKDPIEYAGGVFAGGGVFSNNTNWVIFDSGGNILFDSSFTANGGDKGGQYIYNDQWAATELNNVYGFDINFS